MSKFPLKAFVLFGLCLIVAGCATKGSTLVSEASKQFNDNVSKWATSATECQLMVIADNRAYFDKVVAGAQDSRRVQLVTLTEPISKKFRAESTAVVSQLDQCMAQAYNFAVSFNQDLASTYQVGVQNLDAVYINMINGQYKTYGQFNQILFSTHTANWDRVSAAISRINSNYAARYQAELKDENYRTSMALMMFGAGMQNAAASSQNAYNNVRSTAPVTTNCRQIGGTMSCSSY